MKRRIGIGAALAACVLAIVLYRCRASGDGTAATASTHARASSGSSTPNLAAIGVSIPPRVDPRTQPRGSIAGTVRDDAKAPIANATVCFRLYSDELPPDMFDEATCKQTDARGAYAFTELYAATFSITAGAPTYRPAMFHDKGDRKKRTFDLKAGEHRTGVDIGLPKGGVEVAGVVNDINGGPIAHARVHATAGRWGEGESTHTVETDERGAFALWTRPGPVKVSAKADGYAAGSDKGRAPGRFEILLTPESSLAGKVVDARTGSPIEGADVSVHSSNYEGSASTRTDASGAFRVIGLTPGRYVADVEGPKGYGRSEGSTLVGLGQYVDGVIVRVFPAARIVGKVVIAGAGGARTICVDGGVSFRDDASDRWVGARTEDDGTIVAEGVLPGTYMPQVWCDKHQSRDDYKPITIADTDLVGLVWEVDVGGTVTGRVLTRSGEPIEDARIQAQTSGNGARAKQDWSSDTSTTGGQYELTSLKTASYKLEVETDKGIQPREGYKVDAKAGTTVTKDLVLEDGGALTGTVVDGEGTPIADVTIDSYPLADSSEWWKQSEVKSDATGAFRIEPLRAGDYRVSARNGQWDPLRKPGTTDDDNQGEKVTIAIGKTATVKLVVEAPTGVIKGTVVDTEGKPVPDAFISSARESDAAGATQSSTHATRGWGWFDGDKPVLTATDGTFAIRRLAPGKYTLRAYRKGGGEAIAEHVATGATAKLQIRNTGSIEGVAKVASGPLPSEITVNIEDLKSGFSREETYFRTDGRFAIHDVPAGHFHLTVHGNGGQKKIELDLAEGQRKTGVTVELEALLTLTGRVVDHVTKKPVASIMVFAQVAQGGGNNFAWSMDDLENISDETGRFVVKRAPKAKLAIQGGPREWKESDYSWFRKFRDLTSATASTVDLGDITILAKRIKEGETPGETGVRFKDQPPETPPEAAKFEISFIEPKGAAAKTELRVGDIFTSIDGMDIQGENSMHAWTLLRAPAGTKLVIGLARGTSITIVLEPPR